MVIPINKIKDLPVAGKIVASKELENAIKKYENRSDEQGRLIVEQLKKAKELIDNEG